MTVDRRHPIVKRARFTTAAAANSMNSDPAALRFGREIRVFETSSANSSILRNKPSSRDDPPAEFYDLKPEDYYRIVAKKKCDRKIEAEEVNRSSKVRVRFPDNYTLEAVFHSSETIGTLVDLLRNVVKNPEAPFYIYTTPPKKVLKDISQDFYSAGFVPGAIVHFAYDLSAGIAPPGAGAFLSKEFMAAQGLEIAGERAQPAVEPETAAPVAARPAVRECRPAANKMSAKPKWVKS